MDIIGAKNGQFHTVIMVTERRGGAMLRQCNREFSAEVNYFEVLRCVDEDRWRCCGRCKNRG